MTTTDDQKAVGTIARLLPRAGFIASAITTVCCLGVSAAVSLASTIGATFLTRDTTLKPLLAVSLAVTVAGSAWTYPRHHHLAPLLLTIAASAWIYAALYGPLTGGIGATHAAGGHGAHRDDPDPMRDTVTTTAGAHGGAGVSATALVWIGLGVLLAAQLWDLHHLHRCNERRAHVGTT